MIEKIRRFLNRFKRNNGVDRETIIREISRKIDGVQFKIDLLSKRQIEFHAEDSRGFSQLTLFSRDIKSILDEQIENSKSIKKAANTPQIKSALIEKVTEIADKNISISIDAKLLTTIQEMHLRGEPAYLAELEKKKIASRGPLFEHLKKLVESGRLKKVRTAEKNKAVYVPAYVPVEEAQEEEPIEA